MNTKEGTRILTSGKRGGRENGWLGTDPDFGTAALTISKWFRMGEKRESH